MNDDVVEVNGFNRRMLPGSFLYEKEPGYEARSDVCICLKQENDLSASALLIGRMIFLEFNQKQRFVRTSQIIKIN